MVTVNEICQGSHPVVEEQFTDSTEGDGAQLQQPTREERLAQHRVQCQNLVAYLMTNLCPPGLAKKDVRNIKNQAKTHQWDFKSKKFAIVDIYNYVAPKFTLIFGNHCLLKFLKNHSINTTICAAAG